MHAGLHSVARVKLFIDKYWQDPQIYSLLQSCCSTQLLKVGVEGRYCQYLIHQAREIEIACSRGG